MSRVVVPAEELTAYQRWEPGALAGAPGNGHSPVALPTAADVERVYQTAHAEGRAAGLAEGRARAAEHCAQLAALVESLQREQRQAEAQIASDLLALALVVARQIVREALSIRPELIVPLVREALQQIPAFSTPVRLALHPADAAAVRAGLGEHLAQIDCRIVEDGGLERGGCRIEGAATHVDATLRTRWERTLAALGHDPSWLAGAGPAPGDGTPT